jgi:hypothetical protein
VVHDVNATIDPAETFIFIGNISDIMIQGSPPIPIAKNPK